MLEFVFREHFRLAVHAALLFAVGLFVSWPVVRYRLRAAAWLPLTLFRLVVRLIEPSPGIVRTASVIFCFNATVMFIYMASGLHELLPKAFGIWTGLNVGVIAGAARQEQLLATGRRASGGWLPPRWLSAVCGLAVLALEMPCFWFAVAMGISMGHAVQDGGQSYLAALAPRAAAYAGIILPLLLLSATAEAVAIRGSSVTAR